MASAPRPKFSSRIPHPPVAIEIGDRRTKRELDQSLRPFRIAAAAWSGGVMLGPVHCDDTAYTGLLQTIANTADLPDRIESPRLRAMIARGLAIDEVPEERTRVYELLQSGRCVPALSFDLSFPETFYPTGVPFGRQGFHAVLGNPPWDTVRFLAHEFLAAFDLEVLDTPTKRERELFEERLLSTPEINTLYQRMNRDVAEVLAAFDAMYVFQKVKVDGELVTGDPDLAKVFAERVRQLTLNRGQIGLVLPAALHIAKSSVGIRRMLLDQSDLRVLYCFNNAKQLFEIEGKVKFDVIVAAADSAGTKSVKCMFGLRDAIALFDPQPLDFSRAFIRSTGGLYDNFLELSSALPHEIANRCYLDSDTFESWVSTRGAKFSRECDPTINVDLLLSVSESGFSDIKDVRDPGSLSRLLKAGYFVLGGEDSIHQFNDHWTESPRYMISLAALSKKPGWKQAAQHFRVLYRRIANVVDLRSMKATVVPPGWIASSPFANRTPQQTPTYQQLQILAVLNSFVFDWNLRLRITNTLNLFIVEALPVPRTSATANILLAHCALRLTCNHAGYAPLWREQLGESWRESGRPPLRWPVLAGDDERWRVRAAIDAVVADAYGLSRDQYAHVLSTFSHASYKQAPTLCLTAFDELKHLGLAAFTQKHDPYWDIPLNESLPKPVIDLPIPTADDGGRTAEGEEGEFQLTSAPKRKRAGRRKP